MAEQSVAPQQPVQAPMIAPDFDYSIVKDEVKRTRAKEATERLVKRCETYGKIINNTRLEMGRDLAIVRDNIGHGNWDAWLKGTFDHPEYQQIAEVRTPRTALRLVTIGRRFADPKYDKLADLPQEVLLLLAG